MFRYRSIFFSFHTHQSQRYSICASIKNECQSKVIVLFIYKNKQKEKQ